MFSLPCDAAAYFRTFWANTTSLRLALCLRSLTALMWFIVVAERFLRLAPTGLVATEKMKGQSVPVPALLLSALGKSVGL